ncbi:NB-ARC domain-containing protein [Leptolyngbyaceae cyanobacterium UHCC 1019]
MLERSLRASKQGQEKIHEARTQRGWKIDENEDSPLQAASKWILRQHQQRNHWDDDDPRWLSKLDTLLNRSSKSALQIRQNILRIKSGSLIERIEQQIETGELLAKGISYGTWKRFAAAQPDRIKATAFKAYCQVLALEWKQIAEQQEPDQSVEEKRTPAPLPPILHNLPAGTYSTFIGRQAELEYLLKLLQPDSGTYRISICGLGGVGKTSLMLEVAHRCLHSDHNSVPTFAAIIFTSAKTELLLPSGILPKQRRDRTLQDIVRAIANTLDCSEALHGTLEQQQELIYYKLGNQSTLLLIDNLETIDDVNNVRTFLWELPLSVKVIITSRVQELLNAMILLTPLSEPESLTLIQQHIQEKQIQVHSEAMQCTHQQIYQQTGGLPTAIIYTIGQLAFGYPLNHVLTDAIPMEQMSRYCFESSIAPLRGQLSHQVLLTISLFATPARLEAIASIVQASDVNQLTISLATLRQLSLIQESTGRYAMLPLTRGYVLADLAANTTLAQQLRDRWVNWLARFTETHGSRDWQEWHDYQPLTEEWDSLRDVVDYCMEQGRYEPMRQLWTYLKSYTHTYGYWQERILWLDWLIQAAEYHQDWITLTTLLFDKVRTLVLMNQPEHLPTAIALCQRGLNLPLTSTPEVRVELLVHLALYHIQQQQFEPASQWLIQAADELNTIHAQITSSSRQQIQIKLTYYQAQICLETGDYTKADSLYHQALEQAEIISWQRAITYIQSWLAVVAMKQQKFAEAEALLTAGLAVSRQNSDQRCIAYCQRSFALLEKERGNLELMQQWVEQAKATFNQLRMHHDAQQIEQLLT